MKLMSPKGTKTNKNTYLQIPDAEIKKIYSQTLQNIEKLKANLSFKENKRLQR